MAEVVDFIDKVKRYYKFTPSELKGFIISVLVLGFVVGFNDGRAIGGIDSYYMINMFWSIVIVAISLLIHTSGQRLWSLAIGYRVEYKMWIFGLVFAVILAFITNGRFWLIVPAGFMIHHLAGHRLGWFRYGINYWALGLIALAGPLITLTFVILLKILSAFTFNAILQKFIAFNIIYTIYCMLPIPPLDGSKIFYGSRMLYAFSFPGMIVAAILLNANIPILWAIAGSFLIGVILWLLYYIFLEKDLWFPAR